MSLFFALISLLILITNQANGFTKNRIAPIRPQTIEEHHNKNRMLLSFDPYCCLSLRAAKHYIQSLRNLYPCLHDTKNRIYDQKNGDYHTYLSIHYANNNIDNLNISCLDNLEINWNDFCLQHIDYELEFEQAYSQCFSIDCDMNPQPNSPYLWHLDYMDGVIDNKYAYIDTSAAYNNVDIFILDSLIQSTHIEFQTVNYIAFDPSFSGAAASLHGTHVAGIIVGGNVGMTQGSPSIPVYDYPICRVSQGCSFSLIEEALYKIIAFIQQSDEKKRVIINLSVQTAGLPAQQWMDYLDALLKQIVDLGGIIVAAAGNKEIDACHSYPGSSPYTLSVAAYDSGMKMYGNTGSCVDLYAPGVDIYSADLGANDNTYKKLQGTSMSAAVITGLIANMLWVNNALPLQQILHHLSSAYHSYDVLATDAAQCQLNGCHLVNWDCDSYNVELLDYSIDETTTNEPSMEPSIEPTDIQCNLPDYVRPCHCFESGECHAMHRCEWDMNTMECVVTEMPSNAPTYVPTEEHIIQFCCNELQSKNKGICKPMDNENECVLNKKCDWDESKCLDEACLGRKDKCKSNKQCCSDICVRFRGVSHCT